MLITSIYVDPNAGENSVCLVWETDQGKEDGDLIAVCGDIEDAKPLIKKRFEERPDCEYSIEVVPVNQILR